MVSNAWTQVESTSELFITMRQQDSLLFQKGFNQCDLQYLDALISEDLVFYHDQSGIQDRSIFLENVQKYICTNLEQKPIRKLKEGSLVVFSLYDNGKLYGAIQKGEHNFYIREKGKEDRWTSTAKFTHVWVLEQGTFRLREALSYDHQEPQH